MSSKGVENHNPSSGRDNSGRFGACRQPTASPVVLLGESGQWAGCRWTYSAFPMVRSILKSPVHSPPSLFVPPLLPSLSVPHLSLLQGPGHGAGSNRTPQSLPLACRSLPLPEMPAITPASACLGLYMKTYETLKSREARSVVFPSTIERFN